MRKNLNHVLVAYAVGALFASISSAAVPTSYQGRPFGGVPREIPGRINCIDYDLGGSMVSFKQDDMANGPVSGGSTAGSRAADGDKDHPSFFKTNNSQWDLDTFYEKGVSWPHGVRYPSATDTAMYHWYIGACHASDWFNFTVHVAKPGKYWFSSIWTSMNADIQSHIAFMGTQYTGADNMIKTPSYHLVGTNSYHAWRAFNDFTSIQLDSGVQVMQFYNETVHLNQDFIQILADSGKGLVGVQAPAVRAVTHSSMEIAITENAAKDRRAVAFTLPACGMTNIALYDCLGREVSHVMRGVLAQGSHTVSVSMKNVFPGVYFIRIEQNGKTAAARFANKSL